MSIGEPQVHQDPCGGIPFSARMPNEFVHCPRLGCQMWWVQGEAPAGGCQGRSGECDRHPKVSINPTGQGNSVDARRHPW